MSRELFFAPARGTKIGGAELLRRVVQDLGESRDKWHKGDFYGEGGSCVLGSVAKVSAGTHMDLIEYDGACDKLIANLKTMHPEVTADNIPDLNDDPAVTYEDILVALEKTVLELEGGMDAAAAEAVKDVEIEETVK